MSDGIWKFLAQLGIGAAGAVILTLLGMQTQDLRAIKQQLEKMNYRQTQGELSVATLKGELKRYDGIVGRLFYKLDKLQEEIDKIE